MSMHSEYAVDPIAISSKYEHFKYMEDRFGFAQGRLIARFPMDWNQIYSKMSENLEPSEQKNLELKLVDWERKGTIIDSQRNYNPNETWFANAIGQSEPNQFQAIISDKTCSNVERSLHIAEINDDTQFFKVMKEKEIPARGEDISKNLELMLRTANTLVFVDPYFDLYGIGYVETLDSCLKKLQLSEQSEIQCEIHCCKNNKNQSPEKIEELFNETNIKELLSNAIEAGVTFKFFCWANKEFHDRFLLSNVGGVNSGHGFRAQPDKSIKYRFTLKDWDSCQELLDKFQFQSEEYKLVEPVLEVSRPEQSIEDKKFKVTKIWKNDTKELDAPTIEYY